MLSIDQRRAVLSLIPKPNKDLRYLKNWRPISLLNTDYKILAKTLATRLQSVINTIISPDQTGYIKGRYIGQNLRTIIDIIEYTNKENISGLMVFLDFQKAFDTISWPYLFTTLKAFNFGPKFRKWIEILYNNPTSCVINNGHFTKFFSISRGIRQGCPISSLLFILVAETLADKIRNNIDIDGIKIENEQFTITQLADDTTLFLRNEKSLECVLKLLGHFENCAGLKLNTEKTEIITLGKNSEFPTKILGINITDKPIKALGIWISKNHDECIELNFKEKNKKLENVLNMWKARKLTIKGKVTVLQSLALSQMYFTSSILYVPPEVISNVTKLIFNFLWPKKEHVKRNIVIQEVDYGGIKMPEFLSKVKAMKVMWIKQLSNNEKWSTLAKYFLQLKMPINDFLKCRYDTSFLKAKIPDFYKQILEYWYELQSPPRNAEEIRSESLFNNKDIKIDLTPIFHKACFNNGLKYIDHIIDNTGKFIRLDDLNEKYDVNLNIMTYNSIKDAIPVEWKRILKNTCSTTPTDDSVKIKINNIDTKLTHLTNKSIYWEYVRKKLETASAIKKWEEYYDLWHFDWKEIFIIPKKTTRESYLHSLQFQILHRYYPCNKMLGTWYDDHNKLCETCQIEDTLEHYFFFCETSKIFWSHFKHWWHSVTSVDLNLTMFYVIFGIINERDESLINALNFCILFGKYFIAKCKKGGDMCCFFSFLRELKNRIEIENYIYCQNGKEARFIQTWAEIYNSL